MLHQLIDEASGNYLFPIVTNRTDDLLRSIDLIDAATGEGKPDAARPPLRICILDSGIIRQHPLFSGRIVGSHDFTGAGIEDLNGHGSMIAYLFLVNYAHLFRVEFVIGKVLDERKAGDEATLIEAINWAREQRPDVLNLSLGIDRTFLGLNFCRGGCKLCRAAKRAAEEIRVVLAAAGNYGNTTCPARSGLLDKHSKVVAIGALNTATNAPESWSGKGNRYHPSDYRLLYHPELPRQTERLAVVEREARTLLQQKKYREAAKLFRYLQEHTATLTEHDYSARFKQLHALASGGIADALLNDVRYREAEQAYVVHLRELIRSNVGGDLNNSIFGSYVYLGVTQKHLGTYDNARENLETARAMLESGDVQCDDRRTFDLYEALGFIYLNTKAFVGAVAMLEKCLGVDPQVIDPTAYEYNSVLLNLASAYSYVDPSRGRPHLALGRQLAEEHRRPTLIAAAQQLTQQYER